jgi:IS30 family transposase
MHSLSLRPRDRYDADLAHVRARQRARRVRRARLVDDAGLRQVVQDMLEQDWSPEHVTRHLRRAHPDRPDWHVCHETIYQALYHGGKGGLSRGTHPQAAYRAAAAQAAPTRERTPDPLPRSGRPDSITGRPSLRAGRPDQPTVHNRPVRAREMPERSDAETAFGPTSRHRAPVAESDS